MGDLRIHVSEAIRHHADHAALLKTENLLSPWAWDQVRDALGRNIHWDTADHDGLPDLGWMVIVRRHPETTWYGYISHQAEMERLDEDDV